MVELKKGEVYTAGMVRKGTGSSGDWELVKVKNGRDYMNIWIQNPPSGISEGDSFRICEFESVKLSKREYRGEWLSEVGVNAKVERCMSYEEFTGDTSQDPFAGMDGELPF